MNADNLVCVITFRPVNSTLSPATVPLTGAPVSTLSIVVCVPGTDISNSTVFDANPDSSYNNAGTPVQLRNVDNMEQVDYTALTDSNNVAYVITLSGLSVVPLTPNGVSTPQIAANNRAGGWLPAVASDGRRRRLPPQLPFGGRGVPQPLPPRVFPGRRRLRALGHQHALRPGVRRIFDAEERAGIVLPTRGSATAVESR